MNQHKITKIESCSFTLQVAHPYCSIWSVTNRNLYVFVILVLIIVGGSEGQMYSYPVRESGSNPEDLFLFIFNLFTKCVYEYTTYGN